MAAFEVKELTGSLFRADKVNEGDRDYSGQARIGDELYWVSGFVAETKAGKKYLKLRFKPQAEPRAQVGPGGARRSMSEDVDDAIPF